MKIFQDIKDVATAPFSEELDLMHLFLIVGIILVFIMAWLFIIAHMREAGKSVLEVID